MLVLFASPETPVAARLQGLEVVRAPSVYASRVTARLRLCLRRPAVDALLRSALNARQAFT